MREAVGEKGAVSTRRERSEAEELEGGDDLPLLLPADSQAASNKHYNTLSTPRGRARDSWNESNALLSWRK